VANQAPASATNFASLADAQRELRKALLAAEETIAAELLRLEQETGLRFSRIDVTRLDSGYKLIIRGVPKAAGRVCQ
jgi:hypothetical protein